MVLMANRTLEDPAREERSDRVLAAEISPDY
jgi:hypothetical protein